MRRWFLRVLLILARDRFFDPRLGQISARHCTDASLMEVPDAGHWILHEEPDLTSGEMIRFFGTVG